MKRVLKRTAALGLLAVLTWLAVLAVQIANAGTVTTGQRGDVAIVLGAAAYGNRPSPVFEERIKHGVFLYKSGRVTRLLFTGGFAPGAKAAESMVGRAYAIRQSVPPHAILAETQSHTTHENMVFARRLMLENGLNEALVVSDPLHLKRALRMASDLGLDASAAPTPTSRYRSWRSKAGFLLRELYFYNHYLVTGE